MNLVDSLMPPPVHAFVAWCRDARVPCALYGGAVTDAITHQTPDDWDFYIGTTPAVLGDAIGTLEPYGAFIAPSRDVYWLRHGDTKIDLVFLGERTRIDEDAIFELEEGLRPGCVTIKTLVYFPDDGRIVDRFDGMRDLAARRFRPCNGLQRAFPDKTDALMYTFLHGKRPDFTFADDALDEVAARVSGMLADPRGSYFAQFPWRLATALVRVARMDREGRAAVARYWRRTGLDALFLPELASDAIAGALAEQAGALDCMFALDRAARGRLRARTRTLEFPERYLASIHPDAAATLAAFLAGPS